MRISSMMFRLPALLLCAGYASSCFAGTKTKAADEPQVKAVSAPSFKQANLSKVAIVWPSKQGYQQQDNSQQAIEDEFTMALMEKGYSVATRSDVQAILQEQTFQHQSGMTDADVSKLGKLLNVPAVMIVSVSELKSERKADDTVNLGIIRLKVQNDPQEAQRQKFVNSCSMGARLLGVEKGEILWFGKVTASSVSENPQNFSDAVMKAAGSIAHALPERTQSPNKE